MDTPLDEEIKRTQERLKLLLAKDSEVVFRCPRCEKDYSNLLNYRELGMCGKCFSKVHRQKLQGLTLSIIGGTIENVEIGQVDPLQFVDKPEIVKMWIKTTKGKTVVLETPERLIFA